MRIRTRFFIAFIALGAAAVYFLLDWVADELRPRYKAAMEESMVDTAVLLATRVEEQSPPGALHVDALRRMLTGARQRRFNAGIFEFDKTRVNMRVYVTDARGIVVFDSDEGGAEGEDYSQWNDVYRTLRGQYGARSTRINPDDSMSSILHVAAPIRQAGAVAGVLTVAKPADSIAIFLETAQREILVVGLITVLVVMTLGLAVSFWITWPIERLTRHAQAVGEGSRAPAPKLGRSEIGRLGGAFEEMRRALEGKEYVEGYVQTLTHQMKAPLTAIRGAAELLQEDMPAPQRQRFLQNLRAESARMQDLIDRMLLLSALENRTALRDTEALLLDTLVDDALEHLEVLLTGKALQVEWRRTADGDVTGERFLLLQAVTNLLQNAAEFSPRGGTLEISLEAAGGWVALRVCDAGPGIPAYAQGRIFERFYSLTRPDTGSKSSGLGLTIAQEVAELHGGHVTLRNRPEGGAVATLTLPRGS